MATVRLFARLRELAGNNRLEVNGETVGEIVESLGDQLGPEFVAVVGTSRIWRNGESASPEDPVDESDEIALLPPVSGGAAALPATLDLRIVVPLVVALVVLLVNLRAGDAWWSAAIVGVVGAWVVDAGSHMEARGRPFPALAVLVSVVGGAVLPHAMGTVGMAVAAALSVILVLLWGVVVQGYRHVDVVAPGALVALLAASATASMVLTRSDASPDVQAIDVFLLVVVVSVLLGTVVDRMADLPFLDPFTVMAVVAILAAVGSAFFWDLDVAGYLPVGLEIAVTLVAGRGLGSLLRIGGVSLTDRVPGILSSYDGAVLAAALYFPIIRLVL